MSARSCVIAACLAAALGVIAAEPVVPMPPKRSMTGMSTEEKEAYLKARAEAKRQRTGGIIVNYATMKGEVAF